LEAAKVLMSTELKARQQLRGLKPTLCHS